jgi:two-component system, NarL family, nitrate/nitrite response regulator NarL
MPVEPIVPTYILQSDGLFREGLRLMLSKTRFRPRACVSKPDDLKVIPSDGSVLFIVGIEQNQDSICRVIRRKYPGSFIVAVSDETHLEELRSALDDGANAALLSSVSPPTLVSALNSVTSGPLLVMDQHLWGVEVQPSEETSLELAPTKRAPPLFLDVPLIPNSPQWTTENDPQPVEQLSAREIAILARIVRGESNKHVARFYNIAEPTVKAHVKAIFRKLGASNRTQAAIWALNHGLIDSANNASDPPPLPLQHARNGVDGLQTATLSALKALKRAVY